MALADALIAGGPAGPQPFCLRALAPAQRGRTAEALAVLAPIATDPHGGDSTKAATAPRDRLAGQAPPASP
jgi:hypothetical protein